MSVAVIIVKSRPKVGYCDISELNGPKKVSETIAIGVCIVGSHHLVAFSYEAQFLVVAVSLACI